MSIIPRVSGILALMYTDVMTVRRHIDVTGPDGESARVLAPVPGLGAIPCRISFAGKDSPIPEEDSNPIQLTPNLICAPDVPIKSGDFITVQRDGREVYSGNIGKPNPYGSSLQTSFRNKEKS